MTTLDLTPVMDAGLTLAAAAVSLAGSIALGYLAKRFKLDISAKQTAMFDDALNKSIAYGATTARADIAAKGWDHPVVQSAVVASAATYMLAKFPEALAGVGLSATSSTPDVVAALQRQLPASFAELAASPATPPATAPNPTVNAELPPAVADVK